jgi:serine/threonine protein kinase/Tol biopolymer transport system component
MKESFSSGANIARYQISSCLSTRGLGEVYLAKDTATEAEVILKVYPSQLVEEPRLRRRFVRIYSDVSALRHQRLTDIYEGMLSEADRPYVAMEFVKGRSLDLLAAKDKLSFDEILAVALQLADALEAAHEAGWLHLAIKPSNLILTDSREIKVLDLGQALAFPPALIRKALDPTKVTLGPPYYFSPEQIGGEKTDQRSDVFSLGTVLYELLAGQKPFRGLTFDEVSSAIRLEQPLPLAELRKDVPPDLIRIIAKALAKNISERYQTIGELARDLRRFSSQMRQGTAITGIRKGSGAEIIKAYPDPPDSGFSDRVIASGSNIVESLPGFKRSWPKLVLAWLLMIGAFWGILLIGKSLVRNYYQEPRQPIEITRISTGGKVANAALSPTGDRLAYTVNEDGQQSIVVREMRTGKETKIISDSAKDFRGLVFSPDGSAVCYIKTERGNSFGRLYRLVVATGAEEDLGKGDKIGSVSFSPDGKKLAYLSASDDFSETTVRVDAPDGAGIILAKRKNPAFFSPGGFIWSPDGRVIACVVKEAGKGMSLRLVALELDSESDGESTIASGLWSEVDQIAWLGDSKGLIIAASEPTSPVTQLWRVDYPSGAATRITRDRYDYHCVGLTRDSNQLMSVRGEASSSIWVTPGPDSDQAQQVITNRSDGVSGVDWTSDERIIYVSTAGGRETIWIADLNKKQEQQLTIAAQSGGEREFQPVASPDDNYVAFIVDGLNGSYLWRAEVEGRRLERLTQENQVASPSFSADGKSIIYSVLRDEQMVIAKSSIENGDQVTLLDGAQGWRPTVSPAGQYVACNYWDDKNADWKIAVFPITGKQPALVFDAPGNHRRIVRWIPDGSGLTYLVTQGGVTNVWMQPLDEKPPVQMTNFKTGRIFDFAWSRDGGRIAFARGEVKSDAVFIRNFR